MQCITLLLFLLSACVFSNCQILQGPPNTRKQRSSEAIIIGDTDENEAATGTLTSTKTIDSVRQGRQGPGSSIQTHKSTVKYANGNVRAVPSGPAITSKVNPPAPPTEDGPFPPAPPIEVEDIRCLRMASREKFSAVISIAPGVEAVAPIFEDKPTVNPQTSRVCQIAPTGKGSYKLEISNLEACGVVSCPQGDQTWLCLSLRFPVLAGLKLPEDEIVLIRCKPQDRTVTEMKDLGFNGAEVEQRSPVTFSGGKQEFVCEIGLFRRLPGTALFSQRVQAGTAVELGEEVQLRSIVRSNDGWFYSKMTDVVIRRLKKSNAVASGQGEAMLVSTDGCRNPLFKTIAPLHPQRDTRSALLHHFNFRVFLFQDMEDGDSVVISARVIACVEATDCAPSLCTDDRGMGYGRRRKRSTNGTDLDPSGKTREILVEHVLYQNGTSVPLNGRSLKGWETDLALKVAMPGELQTAAALIAPLGTLEGQCFLYLMSSVAMATALGVTIILASCYCLCRRRRGSKQQPVPVPAAQQSAPLVPLAAGTPSIDSLVQACYPELQVLDAISRSVRQKKQQVHEQILNLYTKHDGPYANHYSEDPTITSSGTKNRTLRQIKRNSNNRISDKSNVTTVSIGDTNQPEESLYWEIANSAHKILPPTPV